MLTILHNPRCKKSRQGLEVLKNSGKEFQIREYLKEPLTYEELKELQKKLDLKAIEFTRTKEKEFKEA
jgi:arsenate reductase